MESWLRPNTGRHAPAGMRPEAAARVERVGARRPTVNGIVRRRSSGGHDSRIGTE